MIFIFPGISITYLFLKVTKVSKGFIKRIDKSKQLFLVGLISRSAWRVLWIRVQWYHHKSPKTNPDLLRILVLNTNPLKYKPRILDTQKTDEFTRWIALDHKHHNHNLIMLRRRKIPTRNKRPLLNLTLHYSLFEKFIVDSYWSKNKIIW